MNACIGIDTSNYTTSTALYFPDDNSMRSCKKLLPIKEGELGVRQNDAVFHHVKQMPDLLEELLGNKDISIKSIGVSTRPRPVEGSYMPCFEVGITMARSLAAAYNVPLYCFSHQEGHIAAALYSAGCCDDIGDRFYAFHVSGGTTEALLVTKNEYGFSAEKLAGSLDLKAGQVIDRTANMLGLPFPGGVHIEKLALQCEEKIKCRPTMKGADCCLSGVENKCRTLFESGAEPSLIARTCLEYVRVSLEAMTERLLEKEKLPLLFAGGVMSNSIIRESFTAKFGAYFAKPEYSTDNACGTALLAYKAGEKLAETDCISGQRIS